MKPGENPEVEKYQDDQRGETCALSIKRRYNL